MLWVWIVVATCVGGTVLMIWLGVRLWRKAAALASELAALEGHLTTVTELVDDLGAPSRSGSSPAVHRAP